MQVRMSDCENSLNTDFEVINKFQLVHELANIESSNKDQICKKYIEIYLYMEVYSSARYLACSKYQTNIF